MIRVYYKVYLSNEPEAYRPKSMPDARKFLAKPNDAFIHAAVLDADKCGNWKWAETSSRGGWAPWTAFSSYLPIYENTDEVKPWQWPLSKE